ncbi:MAG: hypothetical protein QXM83_00010 [Ignisphaera sp.]|uniref:Probable Brix domain-containing ribosomal biogenesis protein n=1 Tax=Ignisphaera aggregans TaxID=334771 RepID=A0A7C4H6Y7_9CREN
MAKVIITSSRRPTPTVRRFIKSLLIVLPNSVKISRGKLSFNMLALQALDLGSDKLLVVRNKKGNPGYIDVYVVNEIKPELKLTKFCTLYICGYWIPRPIHKDRIQQFKPKSVIVPIDALSNIDNESIIECILIGFDIKVCNDARNTISTCSNDAIIIDIKKVSKNSREAFYEIMFKDTKERVFGPVIRICNAKVFTKSQ